jgi:hypothetical protein
MWRLWHWLFGWHYVSIKAYMNHTVRRIYTDGDGRPYVRVLGNHEDLQKTTREWYPLTLPRNAIVAEPPERKPRLRAVN